jgi:hypothetical protein
MDGFYVTLQEYAKVALNTCKLIAAAAGWCSRCFQDQSQFMWLKGNSPLAVDVTAQLTLRGSKKNLSLCEAYLLQ